MLKYKRNRILFISAFLFGLCLLFSLHLRNDHETRTPGERDNDETLKGLLEELLERKRQNHSELANKQHDGLCYTRSGHNYKATFNGQQYPKSVPLAFDPNVDYACLNRQAAHSTKIILSLNSFFGISFDKKKCPVKNCEFTRDRRFMPYADLVLLNMELDEVDTHGLRDR
jgi:hypothetical protein